MPRERANTSPPADNRWSPSIVGGWRAPRAGLLLAGVLGMGAALIIGGNLWIVRQGGPYRVSGSDEAAHAEVAIVLGAKVRADGSPSSMLQDRLLTAIDLYERGIVKKLLLSGDHGTTTYDEVNTMRTFVAERGVLPEDVFMDHAGFSTYDTMYRARDVFQVDDAVVITQGFHLDRAVYTARALGIDATGVPADRRAYRHEGRLAVREWLARGKALVQLHVLHSEPRFAGPTIPISGDGRATAG